jgi:hypothetical protein
VGLGQCFAAAQRRRQRGGQDFAERCVGVARQPLQGGQQLVVEHRRGVEPGDGVAQRGAIVLARPDGGDHADQLARPERHAHTPPDRLAVSGIAGRRAIVEQERQRHREGDAQAGLGAGHRVGGRQWVEALEWVGSGDVQCAD